MKYLIAQIIGFIAFIFSIIAYQKKSKEKILGNMIVSNILNLIHYLLLGAFSGFITKIIAILRDSFVIIKKKNKILSSKWFLVIFIVIYIFAGIFTYKGIKSLFPIIASIIYIIPIWNGNEATVRKTAFFCYFLWLIYNFYVFSFSGIFSNIVSIFSTAAAIRSEKKLEQ